MDSPLTGYLVVFIFVVLVGSFSVWQQHKLEKREREQPFESDS